SDRSVAALIARPHLDRERAALRQAFLQVPERSRSARPARPHRSWVTTAWMSVLTVGVVLLALAQFGVLQALVANQGIAKLWPAVASVLATAAGAVGPAILAEEYKIRRQPRARERTADE
ncbi:hypothetical protein, partial [Umezawaea sp.]|uniref:hypothetical protein n=1 Tax=Umezawaea sp. TaxID=1955258 RepID=UPI002ED23EBF